MARAAAGQERSPRPPSGRGAHGSDANRSQLALAARLSSIHLWALLRQPVQESEHSPFGGSESQLLGSGGEDSARRARTRGLLGADRSSRERQQWRRAKIHVLDVRVSTALDGF